MMEETKKSKPLRLLTVLLSVAAVAAMLWAARWDWIDCKATSQVTTAGIWAICWSWYSPAPCR